jgi:hypothetical protein
MAGITEIATGQPGYCSVCPTPWRRWPRRSSSTATTQRSSASATKYRSGSPARSARLTRGRLAAAVSNTSTASSAARRTSGIPRCTRAPPRSSAEDARGGLPPRGGHDRQGHRLDFSSRRPWRRTSPSSSTSRPAPPTRRTMCPRNGRTSTRASSTPAGTSCARKPSPGRRSSASSPQDCRTHPAPQGCAGLGRHARGVQAGAAPADGGLCGLHGVHRPPRGAHRSRPLEKLKIPTTRSSSTLSATTAPRPKAPSTVASTR